MNYYEHHLGDWAAATGHLSWDEDMAYTRLLRAYYHAERAIPQGQQYRLAKASTPVQRKAVDVVLDEFFELRDGAYHQKRADEEIARFRSKSEKAKASINARWSRTKVEAGTNNEGNTNVSETGYERITEVIHRAPVPSLQTPDTSLQERKEVVENPPNPPGTGVGAENPGSAVAQPSPAATVCLALRQAGIADVNPAHPLLLALLEAGATAEEFVGAAGAAAGKARGFAYTLAVVEGQRKRAADAALAVHHGPLPVAANGAANGSTRPQAESFYERDTRLKRQRFLEMVGRAPPQPTAAAPAPADVVDVAARELPRC